MKFKISNIKREINLKIHCTMPGSIPPLPEDESDGLLTDLPKRSIVNLYAAGG